MSVLLMAVCLSVGTPLVALGLHDLQASAERWASEEARGRLTNRVDATRTGATRLFRYLFVYRPTIRTAVRYGYSAPMTQNLDARLASYSSPVLSIFRIVFGLLFTLHGTMKLFGWPLGHGGAGRHLAVLVGRPDRIRPRLADHRRALHPHRGLHRLRRDGGRVLLAPGRRSAAPGQASGRSIRNGWQRRRARDPVLLRVPAARDHRARARGRSTAGAGWAPATPDRRAGYTRAPPRRPCRAAAARRPA